MGERHTPCKALAGVRLPVPPKVILGTSLEESSLFAIWTKSATQSKEGYEEGARTGP